MSDLRALEAAAARLEVDCGLSNRLAAEARQIASRARQRHPLGYQVIDAELAAGIAAASSFPPGPEQLLRVERLHKAMVDREAEAEAEAARLAKINDAMALERRLEQQRGGAGSPHRDPAILEAARVARLRIDVLTRSLSGTAGWTGSIDEAGFLAVLDDLDAANKSFASAIGVSRRECRLRKAAADADAAVASLAKAA